MPRLSTPRAVLLWVVLGVGALAMFFPFWWTVVTSLTSNAGLSSTPAVVPTDPSWSGYAELFRRTPFARVVLNSAGLAVATVVIQIATSSLAAYVFARMEFRGRQVVFTAYLVTMMIPMQVLLVPLFVQMKTWGLVDTYLGVLLPGVASVFGIFLLRQAMSTIPRELDEAATIDGAGHLRIFGLVIMPLVRPAVATFAVFSFMSSWNSFLWPLVILRSAELKTLPLALASLVGQYSTRWDVLMAGSVVSVLPMLALYVLAQRHIIQGIAGTGLK
ncbi:MAG: carbohydrate ABC transporter permease [Cellulomonas sp.]|nr:carbohydrate ABC transporter permease [Cellulomonas sp.]